MTLDSSSAEASIYSAASIGRLENLVSFVMVSCGDDGRDVEELLEIAAHIERQFEFHELIYVLGGRARGEMSSVCEQLAGVRNLRVIMVHMQTDYDELLIHGLASSIGDYVVGFCPGEATTGELDRMLQICIADQCDVVRSSRRDGPQTALDRARAVVLRRLLRALVGREVEPLQCRALCLSRGALAKLLEHPWGLRHFRLVDMGDLFKEARIWLDGPAQRAELGDIWRRARLVAHLAALRIPQLLIAFAVIMMVCSMLGAFFGIYAFGMWLFREDVAEGWTSISLVISLMATAIFATLSAICLGITQILRSGRRLADVTMSQEFSNTDLFSNLRRLNVEVKQEG